MWSQETLKQIFVLSSKCLKNLSVCMHLICIYVYVRVCIFACTCFSECICCGQKTNMCISACLSPWFIQRMLLCLAYDRIAGLRNSRESHVFTFHLATGVLPLKACSVMWVLFGSGIWTYIFLLVWQTLNPLSQLINSLYPLYSVSDPME